MGYTLVHRYSSIPVHRYTGTREHQYPGIPVHQHTGTPVYRYTATWMKQYTGISVYRYTGTTALCPTLVTGTPCYSYIASACGCRLDVGTRVDWYTGSPV